MLYANDGEPRAEPRTRSVLNKLERLYLAAIRAIALASATILVIYALWLAATGIYKASRDVQSVTDEPAIVSPEEVTQIDVRELANAAAEPASDPLTEEKRFYADFSKQYYALYRTKFEPFRQAGDQPLSQQTFDQRFLNTGERLERIKAGKGDFQQDKADLESLLKTMTAVASSQATVDRLRAYKSARRVPVSRVHSGTREETYCSYYGVYIEECITYGTRSVPYRYTTQELRLPDGIISHTDLFAAYQDRYLSKLFEKREANGLAAESKRQEIAADNLTGRARLWSALSVLGAFVVLMFLFLLIALERHQRKIAEAAAPIA